MRTYTKITMRIFLLLLFFSSINSEIKEWVTNIPEIISYPCKDSTDITSIYLPGLLPEDENEYYINIYRHFLPLSNIVMQFDEEAIVTLNNNSNARIFATENENELKIQLYKPNNGLQFKVKGLIFGIIPYFIRLSINNVEYCTDPNTGYLDSYIRGYQEQAISHKNKVNTSCGRRKVFHKELIVNGASTKPGDWPWHVAIHRLNKATIKYICGGTLISKSFVLTAAHCATIRGAAILPEILSVVLAKYNLIGGDIASQERQVHEIIIHENFNAKNLDHDISLLKLKTLAVYDDYIQPACIWEENVVERLPSNRIHGTVVGWGFDHTDSLSTQLLQTKMPMWASSTCIRKNPLFYSKVLNKYKFCAGSRKGASPCNGDSGGGFVVYVPDRPKSKSRSGRGAWYVRGIVSVTISRPDARVCDPGQYVVFTDVAKYKTWIESYVHSD